MRNIGAQYWWMLIGVLVPVAAALGLEALLSGIARPWAPKAIIALVLASTDITAVYYAPVPKLRYVFLCLLVMGAILFVTARLIRRMQTLPASRHTEAILLIFLAFAE